MRVAKNEGIISIVFCGLLVAAEFLLANYNFMFRGYVPFSRPDDFLYQVLPDLELLVTSLEDGFIPLWTDIYSSGFPVLSSGYTMLIHPLMLVAGYLANDFTSAYLIISAIASSITAASIYLLFKSRNMSIYAPLALVACMSTWFYSHIHVTLKLCYALGFCTFYAIDKTLENQSLKHLMFTTLVTTFFLLAFYPAYIFRFYLALGLIVFFEILIIEKGTRARVIKHFLISSSLATLFFWPQLWATLSLLSLSEMSDRPDSYFFYWSIPPAEWGNFFINSYYTKYGVGDGSGGWIYYKIAPALFVLACFSLLSLRYRTVRLLFFASIISAWMALGEHSQIFLFAYKLGFFAEQRIPARFLLFMNMSIPILACFGLREILYSPPKLLFLLTTCIGLALFFSKPQTVAAMEILGFVLPLIGVMVCRTVSGGWVRNSFLIACLLGFLPSAVISFQGSRNSDWVHSDDLLRARKPLEGFSNIATTAPSVSPFQNTELLVAQANIFGGLKSADFYATAITDSRYANFLSTAKQSALEGNFEPMSKLGVDGLVSRAPLPGLKPTYKFDSGYYLSKIATSGFVYGCDICDGSDFRSLHYVYQKMNNGYILEVEASPYDKIVVFRNSVYFHTYSINDTAIEIEPYGSFLKLTNPKGRQVKLEAKLSYSKLLIPFL